MVTLTTLEDLAVLLGTSFTACMGPELEARLAANPIQADELWKITEQLARQQPVARSLCDPVPDLTNNSLINLVRLVGKDLLGSAEKRLAQYWPRRFQSLVNQYESEHPGQDDYERAYFRYALLLQEAEDLREPGLRAWMWYGYDLSIDPLETAFESLNNHTWESALQADSFNRVDPRMWSKVHEPNCLGWAFLMLGLARLVGIRSTLMTALHQPSRDWRQLRISYLERALEHAVRIPHPESRRRLTERLRKEYGQVLASDLTEWMFHHAVLVQPLEGADCWAVLDPYAGSSVFYREGRWVTELMDCIQVHERTMPGAAIPCTFPGITGKQVQVRHQKRQRRSDQFVEQVLAADHTLPLEQTLPEVWRWLVTSCRKLYSREYSKEGFLERQADRGVDVGDSVSKAIGASLNRVWGDPVERCAFVMELLITEGLRSDVMASYQTRDMLHQRSFEVYTDPVFSAGILGMNAAVASTGLPLLHPSFLQVSSSQVVWYACQYSGKDSPVLADRQAHQLAERWFSGLSDLHTHPLLQKRKENYGKKVEA